MLSFEGLEGLPSIQAALWHVGVDLPVQLLSFEVMAFDAKVLLLAVRCEAHCRSGCCLGGVHALPVETPERGIELFGHRWGHSMQQAHRQVLGRYVQPIMWYGGRLVWWCGRGGCLVGLLLCARAACQLNGGNMVTDLWWVHLFAALGFGKYCRASPDAMGDAVLNLATQPAEGCWCLAQLMEVRLSPCCSCEEVSENAHVCIASMTQSLAKDCLIHLWYLIEIGSVLAGLGESVSSGQGLGVWLEVLPWGCHEV